MEPDLLLPLKANNIHYYSEINRHLSNDDKMLFAQLSQITNTSYKTFNLSMLELFEYL